MRILAPALLAFALAACSGEGAPDGAAAAASSADEAREDSAYAADDYAALDLQATGIVIPAQGGMGQLELPFGSARVAAEATLASYIGAVRSRVENTECGAGPMQMTQFEGLTLNFQDDRLVGYLAQAPYVPELTRAQMLSDPTVELIADSTIGEEFIIGDPERALISGLFDGTGDDGAVESLWAGTNCIFR